jgi:peptidoglycan/LPS O-acetylase OafA/YrhL
MNNNTRIKFLDGFRGLAILLVISFHAFSRWPNIVPYGDIYQHYPIFENGWLGVQLFFLISGFVIIMTLEKCSSIKDFLIKRWIRLFPSMIIVTILVFATASFFYERPAGLPNIKDIIPGLTFIEPGWLGGILGHNIQAIEGAFWSLFVEVKFYILFGFLYFFIGKKKAINGLIIMFLISIIMKIITHITIIKFISYINLIVVNLSLEYFGWFAVGTLMYLYYKNKNKNILIYSIFIGFLSVCLTTISNGNSIRVFLCASIILLIFISVFIVDSLKKIFENKFLNFIGFISYPLYLIHENMMISMIVKINKNFSFVPSLLLPMVPIIVLILVSFVIAKYGETLLQNRLKKIFRNESIIINHYYKQVNDNN